MSGRMLTQNIPNSFYLSDDFAVALGLKKSANGRDPRNEVEKMTLVLTYLERNRMETEDQQDIIWSRFCAVYLPATVDRFLDAPTVSYQLAQEAAEDFILHNPYLEMLVSIQHTPYFAKYIRSRKPIAAGGKRLPQAIAERLVKLGPTWDHRMLSPPMSCPPGYYVSAAINATQILGTLCTMYAKESDQSAVIPLTTQQQLKPLLMKWSGRYRTDVLGHTSTRVLVILSQDSKFSRDVHQIRREMKNWNVCGMPSCNATVDLKVCGRCQTVRYCTPDHQRAHWRSAVGPPHKDTCCPTDY